MTYREEAIEFIKLTCQDLIDRAEEIVPTTEGIISIDVDIHIPTKSDDPLQLPEYSISIQAYPTRETVNKIIKLEG